jgi:hypothetical protein
MRGPGCPDHGDRVQAGDGPAKRGDAERDIEDEHDDRSDDSAVEHAEGAEEKGQDEGEQDTLAIIHFLWDAWKRLGGESKRPERFGRVLPTLSDETGKDGAPKV